MSDKKWMLPPSGQKVLKTIHSLFTKAFGIGIIVLLVLMIGRLDDGPGSGAGESTALYIFRYVVILGFLGTAVTGFVFSLCTSWGFFRHRWIIIKWAGLVAVLVLLIVGLGPAVGGMTAAGDIGSLPGLLTGGYHAAVCQGLVSCVIGIILVIALSLVSMFKPGRKRK